MAPCEEETPKCPQVPGEGDGRAMGAGRTGKVSHPGAVVPRGPGPQGRLGGGGGARWGLTGRGASGQRALRPWGLGSDHSG